MICPLLHHKDRDPDVFPSELFPQCYRGECAWWNDDHGVCSVKAIAKELTNQTLKMPHAGQFTK